MAAEPAAGAEPMPEADAARAGVGAARTGAGAARAGAALSEPGTMGSGGTTVLPSVAGLSHKETFGVVMAALAERGDELAVVVSDYGRRLGLDRLRALAPEAVVQCGIAEQNQMEVACALANEGFRVFVPAYATFATARVADQLRVCLGMMRAPMAVVGVSCGCEAGILGASHMALEDVALMRSIPGVEVICPTDVEEFAEVLADLASRPRPAYVRMNDGDGVGSAAGCHAVEGPAAGCHAGPGPAAGGGAAGQSQAGAAPLRAQAAEIAGRSGASRVLLRADGTPDAVLLALGTMAPRALEAGRLLAERGVSCEVRAVSHVSPLELDDVATRARLVVTVEEHGPVGGLGSAVAEQLAAREAAPALLALSLPGRYLEADTRDALLGRAGLSPEGIAESVLARLRR